MKLSLSNRALTLVLVAVLLLSAVNTVLIFVSRDEASQFEKNNSTYDYVIFRDGSTFRARNGTTGNIDYASSDASYVINSAISSGSNIYIKRDTYPLSSDIVIYNRKNAQLVSDGAVLNCSGYKIIIQGDTYVNSQYNLLSGMDIINGTIRVEDSFKTTLTDLTIEDTAVGLELASLNTWSEGTKIENTHFIDCTQGIVFRAPTGVNGTGSYANTELDRCYFNLIDNSMGIVVEPGAQFSDGLMQNVRIWVCEDGDHTNQTGLLMRGTMMQTMLSGVVFESFIKADTSPVHVYAINIDTAEINYSAPVLAGGNSFLGTFSNRIYNPNSKWIYGLGGLFRQENILIVAGTNGALGSKQIIHDYPLTIADFQTKIAVQGLNNNETVTVKFDFEYIDHSTLSIEKTFKADSTIWLNETDLYSPYPSQNVLWAVLVSAQSNAATTNAIIILDVYGATT
jgi:hypothetical protein